MKTQRIALSKPGFTLMELMVAMAITTIIVTVLVSITSIALDTWNRSRAELRASRQAKVMLDTMVRDFEAIVVRQGNENEWLFAESPTTEEIGEKLKSTNRSDLIFFSGSTQRYDGNIGSPTDKGGDVSCIGYSLIHDDPIKKGGKYKTFILKRRLVNPDETFEKLLGQKNLKNAFGTYQDQMENEVGYFACENVFQFTVTFLIEVTQGTGTFTVPVIIGQATSGRVTNSFKIKGTGIDTAATPSGVSEIELKAGRVKALQISLTVISDAGIDQLNSPRPLDAQKEKEFMAKNSYQYSKLVQLPSM